MMRKNITRTLTRATIKVFAAKMVDGKPELETLESVTAWGNLTDKEALKAVKEKYPEIANVMVGEIEYADETYKLAINDFVALATKIENGSDEEESEESDEE